MNDANPIDALFEDYRAAVLAKDVDALLRLYDDEVRVFDAWAAWSHDGARAWRAVIQGWFASLGPESVRVTFDEIRTLGDGHLWHASAIVTYAAISASGERLRAMQNRLTWVVRSRPSPCVVHEHTSAPIGVDDMKAILRRGPVS